MPQPLGDFAVLIFAALAVFFAAFAVLYQMSGIDGSILVSLSSLLSSSLVVISLSEPKLSDSYMIETS